MLCSTCCNGRAPGVQSLMIQVAKKASVLKRRKSRNRMEMQNSQQPTPSQPPVTVTGGTMGTQTDSRIDNEGDVVFYMEEPKSGTPNRVRRDNRWVLLQISISHVIKKCTSFLCILYYRRRWLFIDLLWYNWKWLSFGTSRANNAFF